MSDLDVGAKQVERLVKGIGRERRGERDEAVAAYQALPLPQRKEAPAGVLPPAVGVVGTDGGRIQIRERAASPPSAAAPAAAEAVASPAAPGGSLSGPPADAAEVRGRYWREDKIGLLMAMTSAEAASDPCPDIPEGFLDPTRMGQLVRELRKGVPPTEEAAAAAADPAVAEQGLRENECHWRPPQVAHRRLVGSRQSWDAFGPMVAQAAWALGLFAAARRAFLGDGAESNWAVWRGYFSSFVPILDFIHALSYVHAAAHAGRGRAEGWRCYVAWIRWAWQGQVGCVLEALRQRQEEIGTPEAKEAETSPRQVVAKALTYLENNRGRMQYDVYRRQGLPITSSYVESAVKQFNQRVKGTEKFWSEEGAEAILQLRADHLSDGQPLEAFWQRRQEAATGQRPYRRAG